MEPWSSFRARQTCFYCEKTVLFIFNIYHIDVEFVYISSYCVQSISYFFKSFANLILHILNPALFFYWLAVFFSDCDILRCVTATSCQYASQLSAEMYITPPPCLGTCMFINKHVLVKHEMQTTWESKLFSIVACFQLTLVFSRKDRNYCDNTQQK